MKVLAYQRWSLVGSFAASRHTLMRDADVSLDPNTGMGLWQTVSIEEQQQIQDVVRTEERQRGLDTSMASFA